MKNEYKEIENQLRKSLELWSDVMTESNQHGWGVELDFTDIDVFNVVNIMNSICCNIAIKNGYITNVGVGHTELKRVEMREKIMNVIGHSKQSASLNHEDSTLKGGISSQSWNKCKASSQ